MKINWTRRCRNSFDALPKIIKKKASKQIRLFTENLFHPSLKTEKLVPKHANVWSFRIDRQYRVLFTFRESEILLLDIGLHDIYKKL